MQVPVYMLLLIPTVILLLVLAGVRLQQWLANRSIDKLESLLQGSKAQGPDQEEVLGEVRRQLDVARQHRTEGRWGEALRSSSQARECLSFCLQTPATV